MSADISQTSQSKRRTRRELQALPFVEKLRILERLREDLIVGLSNQRNNNGEDAGESHAETASTLLNAIEETLGREPRRRGQQAPGSENALTLEIETALVDPKQITALIKALFPNGIPRTAQFFERLNDFHMRLGWNDAATHLAGALLCGVVGQLSAGEAEALLAELPRVGSPGFFQTLDFLSALLRERELRPQFAAEWFPSLVKRIGNDLASGGFWKALEAYCEHHVRNVVHVLQCLLVAHDEEQISVAAYILGTLRSLDSDSELRTHLAAVESQFSDAATPGPRAVYHRSWMQTAWRGKIEKADLEALASRMSIGTIEEREQAFGIVCRSLLSPSISPNCFEFGMAWLRANVSSVLSPVAKYHVIDFAAQLKTERAGDAAALILFVQPVLPEHKGIWQRLEHFLVALLKRDIGRFGEFLVKFARANAGGWLKVLNTAREFEWFLSEMRGKDVTNAVGQLVFDETSECRKLGLFFFDDLDLTSLPQDLLAGINERQVALAFYESQRTSLHAVANARFLIVLISPVEHAHSTLPNDFYDELVLQLKHYPIGCREEFQHRAGEFPILQKAIGEVDSYFEQLKRARDSGIAAMEVAGFQQAAKLYSRRFSRAISKGAEEMSVFLQMFKKVRLLYGKQWSTFHDGTLSESSGLQQFSSEVEIPRMEFIDPEGMNLRRYQASVKIRELIEASGCKETD